MSAIVVPKVGLTIEEVEVIEWLVDVGDAVEEGQPIAAVNADKTEVEVAAPASGTIGAIEAQPGDVVPVGGTLGHLASETLQPPPARTVGPPPGAPEPLAAPSVPAAVSDTPRRDAVDTADTALTRIKASPWARAVARRDGIDVTAVNGTGPGGRIVGRDVLGHRQQAPAAGAANSIVLRAEVDVAEALGVIAAGRGHGLQIELVDLVVWAVLSSLRRHEALAAPRVRAVGVTSDVTLARPDRISPHDATEIADIVAARHAASPAPHDEPVVVVDLSDAIVELVNPVLPAGTAIVVAAGPIEWSSRVRHEETVDRPRSRLTMAIDPSRSTASAAAAALRTAAFQLARAGDLLAQLPAHDDGYPSRPGRA